MHWYALPPNSPLEGCFRTVFFKYKQNLYGFHLMIFLHYSKLYKALRWWSVFNEHCSYLMMVTMMVSVELLMQRRTSRAKVGGFALFCCNLGGKHSVDNCQHYTQTPTHCTQVATQCTNVHCTLPILCNIVTLTSTLLHIVFTARNNIASIELLHSRSSSSTGTGNVVHRLYV